jgi:hypothetical protein
MKLTVSIDRAAAIRKGCNLHGTTTLDIDVEKLTPERRVTLAALVNHEGKVCSPGHSWAITTDGPSVEDLFAAIERDQQKWGEEQAEKRRQQDEEVAEVLAKAEANLRDRKTRVNDNRFGVDLLAPDYGPYGKNLNYARGREAEITPWHSEEWKRWEAELEATNAAARARAEAERAEERDRKEAEAKANKEKLAAWVRENGTEVARLRLEEGYDSWVTVAAADLADALAGRVAEGLGLKPAEVPDGYSHTRDEERKCPTADEIKVLRAARATAEKETEWGVTPSLARSTYTQDQDDYEDDSDVISRTELRLTITVWPGYEIERDFVVE